MGYPDYSKDLADTEGEATRGPFLPSFVSAKIAEKRAIVCDEISRDLSSLDLTSVAYDYSKPASYWDMLVNSLATLFLMTKGRDFYRKEARAWQKEANRLNHQLRDLQIKVSRLEANK